MLYRQYWVGQKVHSGFFVTSCGKKPNEHFGQLNIWKNIHENKYSITFSTMSFIYFNSTFFY